MKFLSLLIPATTLLLTACDPGHFGKTIIRNESAYPLELSYKTNLKDTSITIPPDSEMTVFEFGGLGSGMDYSCCMCEFQTLTLQPADTSLVLLKSVTEYGNWTMFNENEKRFSSKEIVCEFIITPSDIE